MKALWLVGLLGLLLAVAYDKVASIPGEETRRAAATTLISVAISDSDLVRPALSNYVLLHRTRPEGVPLHPMTGTDICPE
jgi:hypothetical protein